MNQKQDEGTVLKSNVNVHVQKSASAQQIEVLSFTTIIQSGVIVHRLNKVTITRSRDAAMS